MSESLAESDPGEISRFRAIVVAVLRVKQLRRGSKPRIELDGKKHKDTSIAMEEVRRGLITFTQFARPMFMTLRRETCRLVSNRSFPQSDKQEPFGSYKKDEAL